MDQNLSAQDVLTTDSVLANHRPGRGASWRIEIAFVEVTVTLRRREFLGVVAGTSAYARRIKDSFLTARTVAEWEQRRQQILENLQLVMGPLPCKKKTRLEITELERDELPTFTRTKIAFVSEEGDRVPGYLLRPKELTSRVPGMVCLHQTTALGAAEPAGIGGNPDLHYAKELAERGYVTVAPNYPDLPFTRGFGGYRFDAYRHGYKSTTMKGIWNHIRAVDLLQSLPEVIPERIGCIGHSLGGHNTLFVGAFDTRVRVMISSCGFTSFERYYGGDLSGWAQERYMPLIALNYHNDPREMPFDFSDVLAALAPRPVFINAPLRDSNFEVSGVRDCVGLARAVYTDVFHAGDRLAAVHPDAGHSFPPAIRHQAYEFLDEWLTRGDRARVQRGNAS